MFISNKLKEYSRNRIQSLINEGNLEFNQEKITQSAFKLKQCGILRLTIPKLKEIKVEPQNIQLNVVYEDNNLVVINKEAGVVVHPAVGNSNNTLVNALLYHCKNNLSGIGGVLRPGVVHRIDKMTSGLLVFAKDDYTHNSLSEQFKNKTSIREYNLLTWNHPPKHEGIIENRIGRSRINRQKMSVTSSSVGKKAVTSYKLIKNYKINKKCNISYIKCNLMTGRTHQIRVHMSYMGNPLIGDKKYSRNNHYIGLPEKLKNFIYNSFISIERQALHARKLGFFHPKKKKEMIFESKLPNDIHKLILFLEEIST